MMTKERLDPDAVPMNSHALELVYIQDDKPSLGARIAELERIIAKQSVRIAELERFVENVRCELADFSWITD